MTFLQKLKGTICQSYVQERDELRTQITKQAIEMEALKMKETTSPEDYYNNKWKKGNITYEISKNRIVDVRTVLAINIDAEIKLRSIAKRWEGKPNDEIALSVLKYVIGLLQYIPDDITHKTQEYWQTADETFTTQKSDCEDGAILIMKLLQLAGVPAWRRKLCAGDVKYNEGTSGHCYAIYLADDGNWYVLDWCYWSNDAIKNFKRMPHKKLTDRYLSIWFTFNEIFAWSQTDFNIEDTIKPQ